MTENEKSLYDLSSVDDRLRAIQLNINKLGRTEHSSNPIIWLQKNHIITLIVSVVGIVAFLYLIKSDVALLNQRVDSLDGSDDRIMAELQEIRRAQILTGERLAKLEARLEARGALTNPVVAGVSTRVTPTPEQQGTDKETIRETNTITSKEIVQQLASTQQQQPTSNPLPIPIPTPPVLPLLGGLIASSIGVGALLVRMLRG